MDTSGEHSFIILIGILYVVVIIFVLLTFIYISFQIWRKPRETNKLIIKDLRDMNEGIYKIDSAPSILVYNTKGQYTNKIYDTEDRILLVYNDGRDRTRYTYINSHNCQLVDKYDQEILFENGLISARIFTIKNRLFMTSNLDDRIRIISLQTKRIYNTDCNKNIGHIELNNRHFMIISVSPLRIEEIDETNFKKKHEIVDKKWLNDRNNSDDYMIKSNGILINNFIDFICMRKGYRSELIFIRLSTALNVIAITKIDMEEEIRPNGMIYNQLTEEYYISYVNNQQQIGIYKVKYNLIDHKLTYL